jgi:hypothetical protein
MLQLATFWKLAMSETTRNPQPATRFSQLATRNNLTMKSYKDLEIFTTSYDLAIRVHHMTLQLPQFELYEEGSQLRRSSKKYYIECC